MLFVYGSMMPLRFLEEIRFWKTQEKEHTVVIRTLVPTLEPQYVKALQDWEAVFEQTEMAAIQWIEWAIRSQNPSDPYFNSQLNALLRASVMQSESFVKLLFALERQSVPVRSNPVVQTVVEHIIRESEYFLGVLKALGSPSAAPEYRFEERGKETYPVQATATGESTWSAILQDNKPVPIGGHKLPPLPYPYDALEPYIDKETMKLHHDKHHKSYVDGLNKAENMLQKAREIGDFDLVKHWERELAFNGAGHYLHTIFWNIMKPKGGGPATGPIAAEIDRSFGSFDRFKKQFSAAAEKVEGGGWAILVWSPRSHRLEILQAEKHQNLSQWDVIPLLPLDVWEHAYYLKYNADRAKYIDAWWNLVNWEHVNERYLTARNLKWPPY